MAQDYSTVGVGTMFQHFTHPVSIQPGCLFQSFKQFATIDECGLVDPVDLLAQRRSIDNLI
jgi:hypothetical protein